MNIEELKVHTNRPLWKRIKIVFHIANFVIVSLLISLTTVLIVYTPKCLPLPQYEWYEKSIIQSIDLNQINCENVTTCSFSIIKEIENIASKMKKINAVRLSNISSLYDIEISHSIQDNPRDNQTELKKLLKIFHQKEINIIVDFTPKFTEMDLKWVTYLLDLGVDGIYCLFDTQTKENILDFISKISILIENNKEYVSAKRRIFMDYNQYMLIKNPVSNHSINFGLISKVFFLNETLTTDIAENLKLNEKSNWMAQSQNPLMQIFVLLLPNSRFIVNSDVNSMPIDLIASLKVSSLGNSEIKTNESLIYVRRFFIGETTAILLINTDESESYKYETIFKAFKLLNKELDIAYSSRGITDLKKITVNKHGECSPSGLILKPSSSVLLTYPYVSPGFKDLF